MADKPNRVEGRNVTASRRRLKFTIAGRTVIDAPLAATTEPPSSTPTAPGSTSQAPVTVTQPSTEPAPSTPIAPGSTSQAPVTVTQPSSSYTRRFGHLDRELMGGGIEGIEGDTESGGDEVHRESMEALESSEQGRADVEVHEVVVPVPGPGPRLVRDGRGRFQGACTSQGSTSQVSSTTVQPRRRGRDATEGGWRLTAAGAPGGPSIADLIPSFGGHIAHVLWADPASERGVNRLHTRTAHLDATWDLSTVTRAFVDVSGLAHLRRRMSRKLDKPLIRAFIERWQPDTNTFHLPFGEMSILIHDVHHILAVPTVGRACRAPEGYDLGNEEVVAELLGLTTVDVPGHRVDAAVGETLSSTGILVDGLRRFFTHPDHRNLAGIVEARGYLMSLLGCSLFTDKTGDRVSVTLYPLLRDVPRVAQYAWGVGALAWLYRQLGIGSRADCKSMTGCLTLLQSWIFEYFPTLRLVRQSGQTEDELLVTYRHRLDALRPIEVTWCPYGDVPFRDCPQTLFLGMIRWLDVLEPYHPDRCLRQLGFTQIIPSRVPRPDKEHRSQAAARYMVQYGGFTHDSYWEDWDMHVLEPTRFVAAQPPSATSTDYMSWYTPRTHPFLIDPARRVGNFVHDRAQLASETGHYVLQRLRGLYRSSVPDDMICGALEEIYDNLRDQVREYHGETEEQPGPSSQPESSTRVRRGGPDGPRGGRRGGRARR